ncbi:MAG: metallopeptidase TldD-related protein [Sulfolobales archaeon]|nr:metallopeptidase TldD-related protein [Sulfolobales archaeon]MDW7969221.1 metallopeptidase TldD-related protein [Sulfolobales archaeon]
MGEYRDLVTYEEENLELAFRDNNYECNKSHVKVDVKREFRDGKWKIISCQGCDVNSLTYLQTLNLVQSNELSYDLSEVEFYVGSISLGEPLHGVVKLLKSASDVCNELRATAVERCEVIINVRNYRKSIMRDFGEASEGKAIVEFIVGVVSKLGKYGYGGLYRAFIARSNLIDDALVDRLIREAYRKSLISCRSKALNPINIGRHFMILKSEASAAFIHEVSHLLEVTAINKLNLGSKVGPDDFHLCDAPHEPSSPTIRLFDDEGVSTVRRSLIEGGLITDYHHTISTAWRYNSIAGSAYGLYHPPIPFHTTLVMKPGDWRDDEIIAETKKGFVIEDIVMANVSDSYIRIVPERAAYVEGGEIKEFVKLNEVKIPIRKISTLSAISKSQVLRVGYEKNFLVAELAPTIKVEGYVS